MERKGAVITGASQGIGRALVEATECEATRHPTARSMQPSGNTEVWAVSGDIADPETAEHAILGGVSRFGRLALRGDHRTANQTKLGECRFKHGVACHAAVTWFSRGRAHACGAPPSMIAQCRKCFGSLPRGVVSIRLRAGRPSPNCSCRLPQ